MGPLRNAPEAVADAFPGRDNFRVADQPGVISPTLQKERDRCRRAESLACSFRYRSNLCSTTSTSLHACGTVLPWLSNTSICRSFATICSGVNVFFGISRFLSVFQSLYSTATEIPGQVSVPNGTRTFVEARNQWKSVDCSIVHGSRLRNAKGDPERSPLNLQRRYRYFLPLLLPLYYPLAMRVATDHILGKSESKIGV